MPTVFDTKSETTFSVIFFVEDDDNLLNTTSRSMGAANLNGAAAAGHRGVDPELGLDNLCEMKHHMMTRNARSNDIDRRLQPNPASRDMLEAIIRVRHLRRSILSHVTTCILVAKLSANDGGATRPDMEVPVLVEVVASCPHEVHPVGELGRGAGSEASDASHCVSFHSIHPLFRLNR